MSEPTTERNLNVDEEVDAILDSVPWADVPSVNTLPEQLYNWEIVDIIPSRWPDAIDDNGRQIPGKAYVGIVLYCEEPVEYRGRLHTENMTIGTDQDPLAKSMDTWLKGLAFGATNLKKLMEFFGVDNPKKLKGHKFAAFTKNNKSKNSDREFTNIQHSQYYTIGDVLPGTKTVVANRGRRPTKPSGVANVASNGTTLTPCPSCGQEFEASIIIEHVKNCSPVSA
jgi:hypothetical protein